MTFLSTEPKFSDSDNILLAKILQQLIAGGGGGGGSQTPWTSAINGGGFNLSNVATITATSFVGALTGNASTATVLQTARTINGVSFNGSADITLPAGNQTPWASDIDGAGFDLNDVTSIVATEVAANNFAVLDSGGGLGVLLQFAGATFSISDSILDPKLTYNGATWDFVGIVESDSMQVNGVIQATNRLTITQGNANTAVFASTGYSLTGSNATSLIDLAGTWNTSGTPTAFLLNITDTASNAASLLANLQVGGVSKFRVNKAGFVTCASYLVATDFYTGTDAGSLNIGAANDVVLKRDAANTLALRNGVNAQAFRVYNTFTDASNYERLSVAWTSNVATISTANAGTGVVRNLQLGTGNTSGVKLSTDSTIDFQTTSLTVRWTINSSGHILAGADNSYDIGASGATRPRSVYVGTSVVVPAAGYVKHTGVAVASLPAAATAGDGARAYVTDAASQVFGATVTGGGAVPSPVYSDGTVWRTG